MTKTIAVDDGVWEKLVILKLKLKKKNMNEVVEELIKYYDNSGK
jgi:predicted CopG family antitoxin